MSDEFDLVFGRGTQPITFTDRVTRPAPAAPTPTQPASDEVLEGDGTYKAFGTLPAGFGETCDVRRWVDGTQVPEGIEFQYRFLMQVGYVADEQLRLLLPESLILIEGEALTPLRRKLARRQVTFLQQHHPMVWPAVRPGETVIRSIMITRP